MTYSAQRKTDLNYTGVYKPSYVAVPSVPVQKLPIKEGGPVFEHPDAPAGYRGYKPVVKYFEKPVGGMMKQEMSESQRLARARKKLPPGMRLQLEELEKVKGEMIRMQGGTNAQRDIQKMLVEQRIENIIKEAERGDTRLDWPQIGKMIKAGDAVGIEKIVEEASMDDVMTDMDDVVYNDIARVASQAGIIKLGQIAKKEKEEGIPPPPPPPGEKEEGGGEEGGGEEERGYDFVYRDTVKDGPGYLLLSIPNLEDMRISPVLFHQGDAVVMGEVMKRKFELRTLEDVAKAVKDDKIVVTKNDSGRNKFRKLVELLKDRKLL